LYAQVSSVGVGEGSAERTPEASECTATGRRLVPLRADARRNRDRLLDAATELILEIGGEPALDAIARRANVGIGTLYRHFPDREQLLQAVARHALDHSINAAQTALREADNGYDALRSYLHAAVDHGVGVLNLIHPLLDDPDWTDQRTRITTLLRTILEQGKQDERLRDETHITDIVFALIRFSRPVRLGLARDDERAIAHRHLDIYLAGLERHDTAQHALPEPPALKRLEDH
jgi:AcrR family transcriptional regulator